MLSYCELLALKKENPAQDFYIETIIYKNLKSAMCYLSMEWI